MDDVHAAHGAAGVVEDPLLIEVNILGVQAVELRNDVVDNTARVVAMGRDSALRQVV